MATFSVVSHDDGPDNDAGIDPGPRAAPHDRQPISALVPEPTELDSPARQQHDAGAMPARVLELPDLAAASEVSAEWWSSMGNRVFWTCLLLGTLLASILIWNPGAPAERQLDDAPTWSGQAETQQKRGAVDHQAAPDEARTNRAASWTPVSHRSARATDQQAHDGPAARSDAAAGQSISEQPGGPDDGQGHFDAPRRESAPSFDEGTGRAPPPVAARTARSGDAQWDGTSPFAERNEPPNVPPSEAAPIGIINPW